MKKVLIITSEKSGFCNLVNKYFALNNSDICIIENGSEIKIKTEDIIN